MRCLLPALALLAALLPALHGQPVPHVTILTPTNGQTYASGSVRLKADASDPDGTIAQVQYFIDGALAGSSADEYPYTVDVSVSDGRHRLQAVAYDDGGNSTASPAVYFQIGGGEWPVYVLRGPYLQSCTSTSMVVRWRTDWPTNSIVWFGIAAPDAFCASNNVRTSEHEVTLTGLVPGQIYRYAFGSGAQVFPAATELTFRTAPTNTRPVHVWVIGDAGLANQDQRDVRDAFLDVTDLSTIDLWLMLGDNAYQSGFDDEYQAAVFEMYDSILPRVPLFPTIGNHDAAVKDPAGRFALLDIFTLPTRGEGGGVASGTEKYYSFDYANIHFICLDSDSSDRSGDGPMLDWLREDLEAAEEDWIVAYWHQPPYSSGPHRSDTELEMVEMREQALPLLEAYGVDLVLGGHSHVYERSYLINGHYGLSNSFNASMKLDGSLGRADDQGPYRKPAGGLGVGRGTVYVVCGCSGEGNEGYDFPFGRHPCMAQSLAGFGSVLLDFDGLRLDVKFLRPDGTFGDSFAIDKSQPATERPKLDIVRSIGGVELSWPTSIPSYALETRSSMAPNATWQAGDTNVRHVGRRNVIDIEGGATSGFFRLRGLP